MLLDDPGRAVVQPHARGERGLERAHELERALELALAVELDRRHVLGEQVAQQPLDERGLAVEQHRRALARGERADLVPGAREVAAVAQELLAVAALAGGARDQAAAAALLAELLEQRLEPPPLLVVA